MRATFRYIAIAVFVLCGILLVGRLKFSTVAAGQSSPQASESSQSGLERQIISAEREGLDALKTGNLSQFASATADDAVFVDAQGPATKAEVMKNVGGFILTDYSMEDMKFVSISANTGLISYKISEKGVSHGHEFSAQAYVSSVWTHRDGKWLCLFSQETAVPKKPVPAV